MNEDPEDIVSSDALTLVGTAVLLFSLLVLGGTAWVLVTGFP